MANPTDHLTTVRAALDLAGKATPGPWTAHGCSFQHGIVQRSGNGAAHGFQDDAPCSFDDGQANAAAIVALRNAAPAIAELADECAELRRDKADLYKMFDENPSASWSQLRDARARIATLEAELAQARAHRCGGIVLRAEDADRIAALLEEQPGPTPAMLALFDKAKECAIAAPRVATVGELSNHHPDGCHTTNVAARLDCTSDGHHECVSCARFDAAGRAARGDEPIGNHATRGPIGEG